MPALTVGDLAPWFTPATASTEAKFSQNSAQDFIMGGYRAVLFFFGSAHNPQVKAVLSQFSSAKAQFAQLGIHFFGISIDPRDQMLEQEIEQTSHFHWLWDFSGDISIRYQLCQLGAAGQGVTYDPTTFVLDENLRILNCFPLETQVSHAEQVLAYLATLPTTAPPRLIRQQAPVLLVPNVFSSDFCQQLIECYQADGGTESGFMRQEGEKTVVMLDPKVKRRKDWLISDSALVAEVNNLLGRRVIPEIQKAFQFRVTCFERYVVACYEATNQGFFQPHRDNTAVGTAHRRFAMTLNLNSGYEGGMLRFPEYGNDVYAPEPGSALLFSCSLLHEATPVTQGQRFVLLSFLYGDAEAQLRQQTQKQIVRSTPAAGFGNERIQSSSSAGRSKSKR